MKGFSAYSRQRVAPVERYQGGLLSSLDQLLLGNRLARRIGGSSPAPRRVVLSGAGAADRRGVARRAAVALGRPWVAMSRYIGETEKNLLRMLRTNGSLAAFLFFDEADALFGKRSEVKDSHDRYANQEVSYLLQRLESYEGVVVLSTNLRSNISSRWLRTAILLHLDQSAGRP